MLLKIIYNLTLRRLQYEKLRLKESKHFSQIRMLSPAWHNLMTVVSAFERLMQEDHGIHDQTQLHSKILSQKNSKNKTKEPDMNPFSYIPVPARGYLVTSFLHSLNILNNNKNNNNSKNQETCTI